MPPLCVHIQNPAFTAIYINIANTMPLDSLIVVAVEMLLVVSHISFSCVMPSCYDFLLRASPESAGMVAPTYSKKLTSSNCSPLIRILPFTSWQLVNITLLFSMLTMSHAPVFASLVVSSSSSVSVAPIESMSSARTENSTVYIDRADEVQT